MPNREKAMSIFSVHVIACKYMLFLEKYNLVHWGSSIQNITGIVIVVM